MADERTIVLDRFATVLREDRKAGAAITPGQLLNVDANGDYIPHGTAGVAAAGEFARENAPLGKGIDTDIASGNTVPVASPARGARMLARLDSSSSDATASDFLESAGNGNLRVVADLTTANAAAIVGRADESVTAPASGSSPIRIVAV